MITSFLRWERASQPGNLDPYCIIQVFFPCMNCTRNNQWHSKEAGAILLRWKKIQFCPHLRVWNKRMTQMQVWINSHYHNYSDTDLGLYSRFQQLKQKLILFKVFYFNNFLISKPVKFDNWFETTWKLSFCILWYHSNVV